MKQSYSGGDSEGESESQTQEAEPAEYASDQQSYHEMIKTQSDPNLARRVASLNPGKTEQSVQTLFPCVHRRPASEQEPQLHGSGLAVHLPSSPAYIPPFIPHLSALATTTKPQAAHVAAVSSPHVSLQQAYPFLSSEEPNTLQTSSGLHSQPLLALESQIPPYPIPSPSIAFTQISSSLPTAMRVPHFPILATVSLMNLSW